LSLPEKMTPAARKKITADWAALFPGMGVSSPMMLLRRSGPLLTGICLNTGSGGSNYVPTWFVHNLTVPQPAILLSLSRKVRHEYIQGNHHERRYREIAERLREEALLPFEGDLELKQVLQACEAYREAPLGRQDPFLYQLQASLAGWGGAMEDVDQIVEDARRVMATWPARIGERLGGTEPWLAKLLVLARSRAQLEATARAEIVKHKVDKVPATELRVS
jgi:hypothetical protein